MKHTVRRTLLWLGAGIAGQRVLQLLAFLCVGRTLGVAGLGVYAQGLALAAMLAVLAGTGVRNLVARAVAQQPDAARALVSRAVQLRLSIGLVLAAIAVAMAFGNSTRPWFWVLCALHVVPAAFDLKNLLDAAGRTRGEVLLESAAALMQFALIATWALLDGQRLEALAGISLACRCLYATGAILAIRRLQAGSRPDREVPGLTAVGVGQTAHGLMAIGDIALVAIVAGDVAAGYYAVAVRFAAAALLPSAQLARLLLPHLLHAHRSGDAERTLGTALRATLWLAAPVCAGGLVVADGLCALGGADFAASGPTLRLLLLAGCCQHIGWQCSHALLAAGRDHEYANGLGWPAFGQAFALLLLALGPVEQPATLAVFAATTALAAQAAYMTAGLISMRAIAALVRTATAPLLAAAATAAATSLPTFWLPTGLQLPGQLLLGAAAFLLVLWLAELRGRMDRVGDGLATASGFAD